MVLSTMLVRLALLALLPATRCLVTVKRLPALSPRRAPRASDAAPRMVFDFFRKTSEDIGAFVEARAKQDALRLAKFTDGLERSRDALAGGLAAVFGGDGRLEDVLEGLEDALLAADIGYATTEEILEDVRRVAKRAGKSSEADARAILRGRVRAVLERGGACDLRRAPSGTPSVILVIGANGMGKTTTIGKLASRLRTEAGAKVLVCAADTFRAAAVDQLDAWARRAKVDIVKPASGVTSPAAVVYAALDVALGIGSTDFAYSDDDGDDARAPAAPASPYDVVIVDTSGRLATNRNLVEELKKIRRTIEKRIPGAPHEVLLVVDAAVGRNAVEQARSWREDVGVSGLVVTKLDGTSRAGFVVSVVRDLGIPVKLVGVGEGVDDLRDFEPDAFLDALLDTSADAAAALDARYRELGDAVAEAAAEEEEGEEEEGDPPAAAAAETPAAGPKKDTKKKKKKKKKAR